MGRNKCAVFNCKNNSENRPDLRFFQIPKDRWALWIHALQNPGLQEQSPFARHVVCCSHFREDQFNGKRKNARLRHDAVPSLNIPPRTPALLIAQGDRHMDVALSIDLGPLDDHSKDGVMGEQEQEMDDSVAGEGTGDNSFVGDHSYCTIQCRTEQNYASPQSPADEVEGLDSLVMQPQPAASSTPLPPHSPSPDELSPPAKTTRGRGSRVVHHVIHIPKKERTPLITHLIKCERRSRQEATTMRRKYLKKCEELRRTKISKEDEALALLHDKVNPRFFKLLQAEVRNFRRKPQARRWTEEEKAELETMRQRGPRAFRSFPMTKPTRKTLKHVWGELDLQPGLNPHIVELLRKKALRMSPEERACYLVFDEMSLRVHLSLILKQDRVDGFVDMGDGDRRPRLAEEVMVAMVRSIYGKWKMPIAFWFTEKSATSWDFQKIFHLSITTMLQAGFDVRAMVTDGLQKNLSAEHLLGASYEEPVINILGKKIVTIADVPHLLKSLRNALLKYLLRRPDGSLVDVKFIKAFVLQDLQMQPRLAPKLTKRHLEPNNFEKMNVKLAGQLLSGSTAAGVMSYSVLGLLPDEAMATGRFCEEINDFFDSFNGIDNILEPDLHNFKCAININSGHQQLWEKMLRDMDGWEFLGTDRVAVIKNWRMTIKAFKILWHNLQADGFTYLPTGHVNQDCEENLFMGIRYNGGNRTNPSAEDFRSAFIRSFVKNVTTASKGKNCRDDEAINLVAMKDLIEILKNTTAQEPTLVEVSGPSSQELNDSGLFIPEDEEDDYEHGSESILQANASSRVAAPMVKALIAKLNCVACSEKLQTEAAFPMHLHHTMTASSSQQTQLLPTKQVVDVVEEIFKVCRSQMKFDLHLPKVSQRFKSVLPHLSACRNFFLCSAHDTFKEIFFVDIAVQALREIITGLNKDYRDRAKRSQPDQMPRKSTKLQRVAHL